MQDMDKNEALRLSRNYLVKVKGNNIKFSEAWLFGSYAKGNQHANSDIDIALVLEDSEDKSFETEVRLMVIRNEEETLIEPHTFTKEEFTKTMPIVNQIIRNGERIII